MFKKYFESPRKFSSPPRTKESKLLLCKCASTKKDFFTRLDRKKGENLWHFAYAFPFHISLSGDSCVAAKREVINTGEDAEDWNGCPHCGNRCTIFCSCGTIFCAETIGTFVTCPGCNRSYQTYSASTFNTKTSSH